MKDWYEILKNAKGFDLSVTVDDFQVEDDCFIFRFDGNKDYRIIRFNTIEDVTVNDDGVVKAIKLTEGRTF